jgi:TonB family protein
MSPAVVSEVFTIDEVARAAGVDPVAAHGLLASGELRLIPGTRYIAGAEALEAGRRLRSGKPSVKRLGRRPAISTFASALVHGAAISALLWFGTRSTETAPIDDGPRMETQLVFIMSPGPGGGGGGGGGGGLRSPLPPRKLERRGPERARPSVPKVTPKPVMATTRPETPKEPTPPPVPKPIERAPEPLPSRALVAPVVATAAATRDSEGAVEKQAVADSQGEGAGGGAGTGQGIGSGEGTGSVIGDGASGGTGGGPYRPGSGIEPPRLLREVKAEYTDAARRRRLTGDVLLEIVVRRDGSVGDVTLLRGLGAGLDQRAVAAVRQWRFDPARRRGVAVDVIVEVAVEFTLR